MTLFDSNSRKFRGRPAGVGLAILGAVLVWMAGCTPAKPDPEGSTVAQTPVVEVASSVFRFDEVATQAGVNFTYRNGEETDFNTLVESIGGGVALCDFDGDGQLDLFCTGGGHIPEKGVLQPLPAGLFQQRDRWQFATVTERAGLARPRYYSHGCATGDYNNDGFADLFVTGYGGTTLYVNQGDGTFLETTDAAGLFDPRFSTSAAWGDIDGDGNLDLYVTHYLDWSWENNPPCFGPGDVPDVCPPRQFQGLDDRLYRSLGDGRFMDASQEFGLLPGGNGLGVVLGDIDQDGDADIYVANDATENRYYVNDGGRLREQGLEQGVALDDRASANGSMGVDFGDFNGDGRIDIWVANYEKELFALYRNDGELGFEFVSRQTGISELGELFVGFGTAFGDFDRDGDEDLIVANGHVIQTVRLSPIRQLPLLLRNENGKFVRQTFPEGTYLGDPHLARGLSLGDIDADGDLDVAISHNNEPVALLENLTDAPGRSFTVRLVGRTSNRDAVGAICDWEVGGRVVRKLVKGGGSYLSALPHDVLLAVPNARENRAERGVLTIRWPGGDTTRHEFALNELSGVPQNVFEPGTK